MEFKVYKELDQDRKNSIIVNATLAATFLTASIYNTVFSTDQVNMFTFESVINNPPALPVMILFPLKLMAP